MADLIRKKIFISIDKYVDLQVQIVIYHESNH